MNPFQILELEAPSWIICMQSRCAFYCARGVTIFVDVAMLQYDELLKDEKRW